MFPIVNNLNQLSSAINTLNQEVAKLKLERVAQVGKDVGSLSSTIDSVRSEINKNAIDFTTTLNDLRRNIENHKLEIARDIGMIEATILRKCESSMSKMVTDKIHMAVESQKNSYKDLINHEIELKLHAINDGLNLPEPSELDPFDITMSAGRSDKDASQVAATAPPSKRSYAKQRGKAAA